MKGTYVVFEGIVGTGKTTISKSLVEYIKGHIPNQEIIWTREPGGTEIAEMIRKVVQGIVFEESMNPVCEAYLYASSRAQSLRKIVKPVLDRGGIVVSDRSFLTSVAYQGTAKGLGHETILKINASAVEGIEPDFIIYLDLDPKAGLARTSDQEGDKHEKEGIDFFHKIKEGYENLAEKYQEKWIKIDASKDQEAVFKKVLQIFMQRAGSHQQRTLLPFTPKKQKTQRNQLT